MGSLTMGVIFVYTQKKRQTMNVLNAKSASVLLRNVLLSTNLFLVLRILGGVVEREIGEEIIFV